MSTEYGIFNDEGLVEQNYWSRSEAEAALDAYDDEDDLEIAEVCPECRGGRADWCDVCPDPDEEGS